jgi:hypothetical protein
MKRVLSVTCVLLLAVVAAASFGVSLASAQSGVTPQPYWYFNYDARGDFTVATVASDDVQNSAQYTIYSTPTGENPVYRFTVHPNYDPNDDDQETAVATTVISSLQVFNGKSYVDCVQGGFFIVPASYVQYTPGMNRPYFQFDVLFTKYDNFTGKVLQTYPYEPAYFYLRSPN